MAGEDDTDVFDTDTVGEVPKPKKEDPAFQVYPQSRIAVSSAVGPAWYKRKEAAQTAYQFIVDIWDEIMRYYNHGNSKSQDTPRGRFKRGDSTENIIYSNLNIMLPAIYSKDPDITCSSPDETRAEFCKALEALINAILKRRDLMFAKPKIKKAAGMALLTNFGILKLDHTSKDDSREVAFEEMQKLTDQLKTAKTKTEVEEIYGKLEALESNMEVLKPSGMSLSNVLSHNLLVDPYAEQADGLDGSWMMEKVYYNTTFLNAKYTRPSSVNSENAGERVLLYKPTHKASFTNDTGKNDDALGMVLSEMGTNEPVSHTSDERSAYINMYYTECYLVWDKATRRLFLFQKDDWKWPIWVWDDPLKISRFFPYFIISYGMSTGGTVNVGETAYILDHQDDVNDINRQIARIRRSIFDYFYYDSDQISSTDAEQFVDAIRGRIQDGKHLLGIKGEGKDISKMIHAIEPPSMRYEAFFNKEPSIQATNRITNTNDALRGVQYKTNTNEASVQSYQESLRISVGAKVDVIEDVVADLASAMAEITIQNYDQTTVQGLIGEKLAAGWEEMDVQTFLSTYSLEIVAGSMEKPNSVFKKKEAVQISQAIGQFAQAAPGATLRVMLRVLEQAFTEVVIKPEDWAAIDAEINANMNKGRTDDSGQPTDQQGGQQDLQTAAQSLPPDVKAQVVQMKQKGVPDQQIIQFIQQKVQEQSSGSTKPEPAAAA